MRPTIRRGLLEPKEAEWYPSIVQWAELHGWWVHHEQDSRRSRPGYLDFLCIRPPRVLFVEVKISGGTITAEQAAVIALLERCPGCEVMLAVLPRDWAALRDALL